MIQQCVNKRILQKDKFNMTLIKNAATILFIGLVIASVMPLASANDLNVIGTINTLYGTQTYDNVNVTNGGIVYIAAKNGTAGTGTLILNVTGNVYIDSTSSIIGDSRGQPGGGATGTPSCNNINYGGNAGSGTGAGSSPGNDGGCGGRGGAGGASYGTVGGSGGASGAGDGGGSAGSTYGTISGWDLDMGSGASGGGSSGHIGAGSSGSPGGAMLTINAGGTISINGIISMNGGAGGAGGYQNTFYGGGGGGGASGGGILLNTSMNLNLTSVMITADGGSGGAGGGSVGGSAGGSGGGGRVKIFYASTITNTSSTVSAGSIFYEKTNLPPTIPEIINPTNNSVGYTETSLNMTWTISVDADGDPIGYTYQISNNSIFTNLLYNINTTLNFSGTKTIPTNQQMFFRVKANDTYASSAWSNIVSIRDLSLSTPSNGSTQNFNYPPLTDDVYFSWITTNSSTVNFNLLVAQDSAFYLVVSDSTFNGLSKTLALPEGTYYWKVRPYYTETSTYGAYTPAWNFTLHADYNPSGLAGIAGTVYHIVDGTQVPLSDAIVYIHNEALNWSSNQVTGTNGYYLFDNLTNNTVYSISAKATGYEDSVTEYVTTIPGQRITKNILLTKCISGFNCGFYTQPVTFTLRNLFDASFSGVTATVYKGDELTATETGITDSSGSVTFMLNKDQKYRVVFSGGGMDTLTFYAYGSSTNYRILVVSGFPTGGNRNEDISANLTVTTINATHSNLSLIYKDNRSSTTAINFYATNLTTGQTCTQTSTSQDTTLSCAVLALGTYRFGFNATSSIFGFFQQDKTINFGAGTQTNNPLAGKVDSTLLHWGCIMLLVFVAAMFSVQTVKFGAVIVPAMALVFWSLGWMQVNFIFVATSMCIGVMVYLRSSEHKVEY
jgi:hypothetical protein